MNSRDLVCAAIEFEKPKRPPLCIDFSPQWFSQADEVALSHLKALQAQHPNDITSLYIPTGWDPRFGSSHPLDDLWGITWLEGQAVGHPLSDWGNIEEHPFPDLRKPEVWEKAEKALESARRKNRYVLGMVWFTLFERLWLLVGFTEALLAPHLHPDEFTALRDRIVEFNLENIQMWLELGVDGIYFSDDWGTQENLIINPNEWRKLYKPCYQRMFDVVRKAGAHIFLHSDGNISQLIEDFIELGLSVLNPVQPQAMDPATLATDYRHRLCFWGGIDVQTTLPFGRPEDVEKEVYRLVYTLGTPEGGYILGASHAVLPDTPFVNIEAIYTTYEHLISDHESL